MKGAATKQRDWLVILNAPSVGGASLIRVLEALGGASAVAAASVRDLVRHGLSDKAAAAITNPDESKIERDLNWLARPNRPSLDLRFGPNKRRERGAASGPTRSELKWPEPDKGLSQNGLSQNGYEGMFIVV